MIHRFEWAPKTPSGVHLKGAFHVQPTRGSGRAPWVHQQGLWRIPSKKRILVYFAGNRTIFFAPICRCFEFIRQCYIWGQGRGLWGNCPFLPQCVTTLVLYSYPTIDLQTHLLIIWCLESKNLLLSLWIVAKQHIICFRWHMLLETSAFES